MWPCRAAKSSGVMPPWVLTSSLPEKSRSTPATRVCVDGRFMPLRPPPSTEPASPPGVLGGDGLPNSTPAKRLRSRTRKSSGVEVADRSAPLRASTDDHGGAVGGRREHRCGQSARRLAGVDVRLAREQQFDRLEIARGGREHQRGRAVVGLGGGIGPALEQGLDDAAVAELGGQQQRRVGADAGRCPRVGAGAAAASRPGSARRSSPPSATPSSRRLAAS